MYTIQPARCQLFLHRLDSQFRPVVVLADVCEYNTPGTVRYKLGYKHRTIAVRQMAVSAGYTLFDMPRVPAVPEHLRIMVRLNNDNMAAAQPVADDGRGETEIRGYPDRDGAVGNHIPDSIGSVVGNRERMHIEPAAFTRHSRFDNLQLSRAVNRLAGGGGGRFGNVDHGTEPFNQSRQPGDVIVMFVGDEHSVQRARINANRLEPQRDLPTAQSRIDQHRCTVGPNQGYRCFHAANTDDSQANRNP